MTTATSPRRTRLEVCVDTPVGLETAVEAGADRIELCAALDLGGLTPSPGLMRLAAEAPIPVYALIRPRAGGFVSDRREVEAMRADIAAAGEVGLAGVVLGASRPDGTLDADALARLADAAGSLGRTLHRAFDLVPDRAAALELAVELGFERILTSGGMRNAVAGSGALAALVARAGERIIVMPGGGVRPENVKELLRRTGAREVHASARAPVAPDAVLSEFGFQTAHPSETSGAVIRALLSRLP
ncbi:copper homeostasis protein CutC [Aureimonas leprariae]|uniref:PF03932 family protein CutC n=1 Tax=Plantimonas leprariae TaxID=2615207 RepID=A0A7V7PM83_9HYPH|nr:copper homeostasis protein CutC [Aureimonas leprariae]KAB0677743.1 copper homeostasis protein CutC [Aureimonas leprariae]